MLAEDRPAGSLARILHLKKAAIFGSLPTEDLAIVAESMRERFFPKGTLILREGEPVTAIHVIVDGQVHLRRGGRDLGHAGPGVGLGGLGLIAGDAIGIEGVAETDTVALELDRDAFLEILEDHFPLLRHLLQTISHQIVELWTRSPQTSLEIAPRAPLLDGGHDLDLVERIFVLRQAEPFARSSINALAELSRGLNELHFNPGVPLWQNGEPARQVLLLVSGHIACSGAGFAFRVGAGVPLGGLESVAGIPRWYDAVCESRVVGLSGDVETLFDVFEDNFEMAFDYLTTMARWLLALMVRLAEKGEAPLGQFYGCEATAASQGSGSEPSLMPSNRIVDK